MTWCWILPHKWVPLWSGTRACRRCKRIQDIVYECTVTEDGTWLQAMWQTRR